MPEVWVNVLDDHSSMWGAAVKVFGPYSSREEAQMDHERIRATVHKVGFLTASKMEKLDA